MQARGKLHISMSLPDTWYRSEEHDIRRIELQNLLFLCIHISSLLMKSIIIYLYHDILSLIVSYLMNSYLKHYRKPNQVWSSQIRQSNPICIFMIHFITLTTKICIVVLHFIWLVSWWLVWIKEGGHGYCFGQEE